MKVYLGNRKDKLAISIGLEWHDSLLVNWWQGQKLHASEKESKSDSVLAMKNFRRWPWKKQVRNELVSDGWIC